MTPASLTSDERQKIRLYFLDTRLRYAVGVLFVGLVLVELSVGKLLLLAGLLWLGAALVLATKRPSDGELDDLLSHDLQTLVEKARQSLAQEQEVAPPLAIFGPAESAAPAHNRVPRRTGKDGRPRSSLNQAVILLPMEDQLGIYSCLHDSLSGLTSQISVEEHHYRDVVSLRFEENVEVAAMPAHQPPPGVGIGTRVPTQMLSLELTNGRRLSVPVSVVWQGETTEGGGQVRTGLEKTLLAIRALMRDKR